VLLGTLQNSPLPALLWQGNDGLILFDGSRMIATDLDLTLGERILPPTVDMDKLAELLGDEEVSVFPTGFAEGEVDLSAYLPDEEPELPIEEEPEEEPEEQGEVQESTTVIKIGGFSFTATASEYYGLLESIRDAGIFDSKGIVEEIKRRILND